MTWPLTGIARFDATVEGPVAAPRVEGRITVPELAAGSFRARAVHLEGSFGDGTLHLRDIHGDLPGGPVRGAFTLSPDRAGTRRVHLSLDGLRLPGALASLGPADVQAEGRLDEGGGIGLGPATARWAAARLDVAGRVEPGGPLGLRADLAADLGPLARALGATDMAGPAHVTVEATGTWDRPVVAGQADVGPLTLATRTIDRAQLRYRLASSEGFSRWTGTLETPRVVLPGVPIEALRAAVVLDAERVEVQPLTARVRGIPLTLQGTWDWGGDGRAEGDLGPVALGGLPGLPAGASLEGSGEARFRASTQRGTVSATAAIGLRDVSLGGVLLGPGRLDVGVTGRDLTAALEFPAMGLSATGRGRLEEGRTITAQARLERANLDPIVARLAPAARGQVLGSVSARAEAEVPFWRPEEIRMTASITPERARRRGRALDDSLAGSRSVGPRAAHGGPVPGRGPAGDDHGIRRHGRRRERRPHRARAGAGAAAAAAGPGHAGRGAGGGAAHQDRAGGCVDPRPLAGGNAVPGRPRAVRRADRAPQPARGRRGRVGA